MLKCSYFVIWAIAGYRKTHVQMLWYLSCRGQNKKFLKFELSPTVMFGHSSWVQLLSFECYFDIPAEVKCQIWNIKMHFDIWAEYQNRMSEWYFDIWAEAKYIILNVEIIFYQFSIVPTASFECQKANFRCVLRPNTGKLFWHFQLCRNIKFWILKHFWGRMSNVNILATS